MTIFEFSCLSKCNGLNTKIYLSQETTKENFKYMIMESNNSMKTNNPIFIVVSFSRKILNQTGYFIILSLGDGHFSPLGKFKLIL
jgi:hypothetical protein